MRYLLLIVLILGSSSELANAKTTKTTVTTVKTKDTTPQPDPTAELTTQLGQLQSATQAQVDEINNLKSQNMALSKQLTDQQTAYQKDFSTLKTQVDTLASQQQQTQLAIDTLSTQQHKSQTDLTGVNQSVKQLNAKTHTTTIDLANQLNNRTIGFILGLLTLLGLTALTYYLLSKRQKQASESLSKQVETALANVKTSEENIVKADTTLADKLLEVTEQLKQQPLTTPQAMLDSNEAPINVMNTEPDHGLAIKLADEIHRMRKRIEALPEETKGLKSLSKSLERLEDELNEQGYEMVDYLGTPYTENMSVNAKFVGSDDVESGHSIISKVVSPQVNYQGKLVRMADVEVSVG